MNIKIIPFLVVQAAALQWFPVTVQAQDEERAYDANISLGFVGTTGNTDTQTFNLEALYTLRTDNWTHNVKFQGLGSSEDSETKAERYYLEDKSNFGLGDDAFFFLKGSYTDDRFSGFEYQAAVSLGLGRYFFNRENFTLEGFGGVGGRRNDIEDAGSDSEVIFSLGEALEWQISESASLTQSFSTEIGQERTVSKFEVGLVTNIIGGVATKVAFQARNTSNVPMGRENTDTQTSVSLVYEF